LTADPARTILAPAIDRLRAGDLPGARQAAEAALADAPDEAALLEFAGHLAARMGDSAAAVSHFRRWLAFSPDSKAARVNLATALMQTGELEQVAALCASAPGADPKLLRLSGYVHQQLGRLDASAAGYAEAVAADPADFESWTNLGNVRALQEDHVGAIAAFDAAIRLRPDVIPLYFNLSEMLLRADRPAARRALMRDAARRSPEDADVRTELGRAELGIPDFPAAERAFREAIRLNPVGTHAYLELGALLDLLNRLDELDALVAEAEVAGVEQAELGFLKAGALRRRRRFAEALPLAEAAPATLNPTRRAQLVAELKDRLGDTEGAFAAYREMNAAALAAEPLLPGPNYRETVEAGAALLTPDLVSAWTRIEIEPLPPAPAFIVGFPRSGTTLLDTLLMNLPQLHVLEEQPVLYAVEDALGGADRLANLTSHGANALRRLYFEVLDRIQPVPPGTMVIDKFPLHMAQMPLIHRLFPEAKVVLVERHPCDAVLSCFMASFQLNRAMRTFTDLVEAARTYDAVFEAWTRATSLLPIALHRVRYERMVENLEGEMRGLLDFLDLPWDPAVLDNRAGAAKRAPVLTASYAQVGEPVYRRSAGRWERYRRQLEPVLPILAPWAEGMGYRI
jgi:tetratricopeptide (TPR) repeat protein